MSVYLNVHSDRAVVADGEDLTAREDYAIASVFGKLISRP